MSERGRAAARRAADTGGSNGGASGSDEAGPDPLSTDRASTDPASTDPASTDEPSTDPASTDPASADEPSADEARTGRERYDRTSRDAGGHRDVGHRGGFGEFGGQSTGLIDRAFRERIALVGVTLAGGDDDATRAGLDELALLVDTAGADVVERVIQHRVSPDPATFLGKGKLEELTQICEALDVDTVVFDEELSPAQQRNLEKILGRTAIDRTAVILDIFAQNASSQEGRAQVELAQLRYRLPRLRGRGSALSQQAGGIGTRGPGETQLEVDRRRIERRLHKLEASLRGLEATRATQGKARVRSGIPLVAIVGYTNAGKSTLLNRLTNAGVLVEDRLFATLDATTRRLSLPGGNEILLADTVGFVTKLPHQLVQAFRSTLDVAAQADLLVHVVDAFGPVPEAHMRVVGEVLAEIGAGDVPVVDAFNKADLAPEIAAELVGRHPGSVAFSAVTGVGVDDLLNVIGDRLRSQVPVVELLIPWDRGDLIAMVHRDGAVLSEISEEGACRIRSRLPERVLGKVEQFRAEVAS